jgi:hypothetical protein
MSGGCNDNYSVEVTWNGGDTFIKQSANAASRKRAGTTSSFIDYLNTNNVTVKDIVAGASTGELIITYTDSSQKTVTVPV